jgi:hypothetical protein
LFVEVVMNDSRPKIDELLIDELVSGQLSGEPYRAALRALDATPAKWRDCALAFLEEQALRTELRALALGTINWCEDSSVESIASVEASPQPSPANMIMMLSPSSHRLAGSLKMTGGMKSVLSTAALLLVSFTVGWLGSEVLAERRAAVPIDSRTSSVADDPSRKPPAMSSQSEPQFFVDRPGSFDRAIRELEHDGRISVRSYEMLVPTTLDDGSSAFVPVRQLILGRGTVELY